MIKSNADFEWLSIKFGTSFSKVGISPNTWTVLAIFPAILGFIALASYNLIAGLILFMISGVLDAIDGSVARVTKNVTNLGAFLDGVIDRYVELLLYLGLLKFTWGEFMILPMPVWVILMTFGAIMPSFVRAYADHRKVVTEPEDHKKMGGLMERFERLTVLYSGMLIGIFNINWLYISLIIVAILTNFTAIQRIIYTINYSKKGT